MPVFSERFRQWEENLKGFHGECYIVLRYDPAIGEPRLGMSRSIPSVYTNRDIKVPNN